MVFEETLFDIWNDPGDEKLIDTINWGLNILTIEDSLVWYWNNGRFDTLFNFAANIGDKWTYAYTSKDTLIASVFGKGTDSQLGFYLEIEYTSNYFPSRRDTVYEYLLGGSNYIIPWDREVSQLDGQRGGPLRCFTSDDISYVSTWWEEKNLPCMFLSKKIGVEERNKPKKFTIYPNPSSGSIHFKSSANKSIDFIQVINGKGQIVHESKGFEVINNLSPQLYFIRVYTDNGTFETHKVFSGIGKSVATSQQKVFDFVMCSQQKVVYSKSLWHFHPISIPKSRKFLIRLKTAQCDKVQNMTRLHTFFTSLSYGTFTMYLVSRIRWPKSSETVPRIR